MPDPGLLLPEERWVWVPFEVDKKFDGLRIDQFLAKRLIGYSRNQVQKMLQDARVLRGSQPAKANQRVRTGEKITIAYARRPEEDPSAELIIPILFEDEALVLINKPPQVLSHPTDKVVKNTVLALLRRDRPDLAKLHLLHRLDRETSGVLALAKEPEAARRWTAAMERHEIQKEYLALVRGVPAPAKGLIDKPIGREGKTIRVRQGICEEGGVSAVTAYETLQTIQRPEGETFSLVRCLPKTGRLHQIRVHLASIGHPLLGDPLYTGEGEIYLKMVSRTVTTADRQGLGFPRVALHAAALAFPHPRSKQPVRVEAPLPSDMADFLG